MASKELLAKLQELEALVGEAISMCQEEGGEDYEESEESRPLPKPSGKPAMLGILLRKKMSRGEDE